MAIDAIKYFERQIQTLEQLKQTATPTQLSFYTEAETEIRSYLEEAQKHTDPEPMTPEKLQARITRTAYFIQRLEREIATPELGEHWINWAKKEMGISMTRLETLSQELKALSPQTPVVIPAKINVNQSEAEDALEVATTEVAELEMLQGLLMSWIENSDLAENALNLEKQRLAELNERLKRVRHHVENLTQASEHL